ncbi:cohesin subunit SA-2-like isoform X1 [Bufo bufo]|uniref:cohesin subunit SA-2-like isoform X1 n=1 Tax=Bufo bufo TaxID=8384 RepID=UPI001ABDD5FC|nr:cohesin subunit SA-2-like isoform X1 [Bufo bufo]XP_040281100.1 cohesin subunit SA-2-like isoform X1 [Bufo bufo]XP_040281102.1 cohesin subunit SA-2-like isoform X1 [Bufo bufo]
MIAVSNSSADLWQKENANSNSLASISNGSLDRSMTMVKRSRRQSENLSRRNSLRHSRDSRISNGEIAEAVTLYEVISIGKRAIQSVVDDWIEAYQEDRDAALLDLINFYIQCSGCQGVVTAELFQNPVNKNIMQKLTEEFDKETGLQFKKFMAYPWILTITWPVNLDTEDYPLIRPGTYWKKFRSNFCEFTSVLVQQCQYSVIYDGYLLNTIVSLLLGLSESCVRAFRHTSTLSAVKLLTALIRVILNLDINIDNSDRLYEVEKKRADLQRINLRLEQLDKRRKKLQQRHREIKDMMDAIFKGTFLQRYRDVVSEIRALCIEEIGVWLKMHPHMYLSDSYLKYVGWMLHDKVPDVRLRSLIALQGLYEKNDLVSKMDLFTTRFKDRIVSMTLDKDHEVSVQSMRLLVHMLRNCDDSFTTEDCETLYQFVYASHRPLAAAAGEFLYIRHLGPVIETMSAKETVNSEHKISQMKKLLDFFLESKLHDHVTYLVDSLWDCTPGFLKDWQWMTSILLQDATKNRVGLSAVQENLLVELMLATVRQAVEGHPPVGRGAAKKVLSAKEKKAQLEDRGRITEHFAGTLPLMLAKFSTDPDKVINLLQIPQFFDIDVYFEARMEKHLEALLKQMKSIAVGHSDSEVLEACSKTYSSLSHENHTRENCQVSVSKKELIKHLVDTYSQMLDDVLQEGEEPMTAEDLHPVSCTLRRLSAFHNAHNLSPWDVYQKTSELLTFDVQRQGLPAELVLPALQCTYYAILWQLLPLVEHPHTQEENSFYATRVKHFCQLCRKYLGHKDQSVREQAFLSLCDLLMLLQNRGGRMLCCVDSVLETEMLFFVRRHVFQKEEEKDKDAVVSDTSEDTTLVILHRKRMLLAVYCKLIASSVVEMSAVAEIYKQYMKTYNDFGDIIKETLSRTRNVNRIECAKTLVLCLKQLFLEHREAHDSATQSSSSFTNIKELARRFSLTFGMDHVKCRESIAMMHKQGIEFAFKEPATEDSLPPPNLPFLMLISEFSSKLLRADKRLVYGYLQRFASEQMMLSKGAGWHPLILYSNSLLDNHDEESSSCGSYSSRDHVISSTPQHLKRKSMYEHFPGRGLTQRNAFDGQDPHYPTKSKKQNALHLLPAEGTVVLDSGLTSQDTAVDENNEEVEVDEIETD